MTWQPFSPAVLGLDWRPVHEDTMILNSPDKPLAAALESSVTETVNSLWYFASLSSGERPEAYQVDVYEAGDFPDMDLATYTAYPSSTPGNFDTYTWNGSSQGSSSQHTFENDPTFTPVDLPAAFGFAGQADNQFVFNPNGISYATTYTFNGLHTDTAGERIVKVRLEARAQAFSTLGDIQSVAAQPVMILDGRPYWGEVQTVAGPIPNGGVIAYDWFVNPAELRGWLPADLEAFDAGTNTAAAGLLVRATGNFGENPATIIAAVYQVKMMVTTAGTDIRKAFGWVPPAAQQAGALFGVPAWFELPMQQVDGSPGWPKSTGADYRIELSRRSVRPGGKQLWVIALQGYDDRAANGWTRVDVKYDPSTHLPYVAKPRADGKSWAPACVLATASGPSVDSQPYAALDLDSGVWTGRDWRQYFTTPGTLPTTSFPLVRVLLGRVGTTATGPVMIRIRRVSDNAQMGGTVTLSSQDFDDYPDPGRQTFYALYKSIMAQLVPAATLATSTQYYFQVTSTAEDADTGWTVESLRSIRGLEPDTPPTDIEDATFGGTVDRVAINGTVHTETDAAIVVLTQPSPPTGLVAAAVLDDCIGSVAVTWNPTSLSGSFGRYEVQRLNPATGLWEDVAWVTDETVDEWEDHEALIGVVNSYRMRVVRADTAVSLWTATATAAPGGPCCGFVLTSNQHPELTVWYDDMFQEARETELPQNVNVVQFYDRDMQVAFHELEDRGARFTRQMVVAVNGSESSAPVAGFPGLGQFSDLLAISRPSNGPVLPYVCVHELATGDRWFASLLTPTVSRQVGTEAHVADVEVIETTRTPAVVVVDG